LNPLIEEASIGKLLWLKEVKQVEKIVQAILYRRSREEERSICESAERAPSLVLKRGCVPESMCLVED